jgi:hypothetical protein
VVGVVFFGLLSSRATTAVATVTPQLQTQLAAAGVPPAQAEATVETFTRCFKAQAASSDPSQPVPNCPVAGTSANPVSDAIGAAARIALGRTFVSSVERILFFNIGFWALTGILSMFLPRIRPQQAPSPQPAGAHAG